MPVVGRYLAAAARIRRASISDVHRCVLHTETIGNAWYKPNEPSEGSWDIHITSTRENTQKKTKSFVQLTEIERHKSFSHENQSNAFAKPD